MLKNPKNAIQSPYYLWIVGIIPILHLYRSNFGLVRDSEAALAVLGMLVATSGVYLLAGRFVRNRHQRALYLCLASLAFSLSGHLYEIAFMSKSLLAWDLLTASAFFALLLGLRWLLPLKLYDSLTPPFNLAAAALLAIQLIALLSQVLASQDYTPVATAYRNEAPRSQNESKVMDSASRPDIYYIIPDGYPSDATLLSLVNYDNSDFTDALVERGFSVVPQAQSNYGFTDISLPSILNMKYFAENPTQFSDLDYLRVSTANNEVVQELLGLGYTYAQLLSGYLYISPFADIAREFTPSGPIELSLAGGALPAEDIAQVDPKYGAHPVALHIKQPFIPLYLDTTALRIVRSQLEKFSPTAGTTPYPRKSAERFLANIDSIDSIVAMPEATFTIMHLLEPYHIVNFNENGDIIPRNTRPSQDDYVAELPFVNSQFLRLIDTILQGSRNQPVIIFQADHGNKALQRYGGSADGAADYNAYASYYLPDEHAIDFPSPFTLVNSFPLVLNQVFGMDLELQENRIFHIENRHMIFEQQDVTTEFLHR